MTTVTPFTQNKRASHVHVRQLSQAALSQDLASRVLLLQFSVMWTRAVTITNCPV